MPNKLYRSFQAFVLLTIASFLTVKLITGKLDLYINLRFAPLTVFAIIVLTLMIYALVRRPKEEFHQDEHHDHQHEHTHSISFSALIVLLIPILIGILIPARPLDAAAASTRGVNVSAPIVSSASQTLAFEGAADQRNVLDWIRIFNRGNDVTTYLGETANVIGFVYKDHRLAENQFLVSRFVITCCAADGFAIGMVVNWEQAGTLNENTWVNVKGAVKPYQLDDQPVPLIEADTVDIVEEPPQPYLFP
jgi:putative membrane protein